MLRILLTGARLIGGAAIGLAIVATFLTFRYLVLSWPVPVIFRDYITIPEGVSTYKVASLLKNRGLIDNERMFVNAVRTNFGTRTIKAGHYQLLNVRHMGDLVSQILKPRVRSVSLTIPEGITNVQVGRFVEVKYPIDVARFLALANDEAFIASLGLNVATLEGYLYPETYQVRNGMTEAEIIALMVYQTRAMLSDEIALRGQSLGFSTHEILTMASIIEGEARIDSERVIISAVYHNRLRKNMHLQADPTVQYALGNDPASVEQYGYWKRELSNADLRSPSPYNTYANSGLPPGPIANPGLDSILAALEPADTSYLYFVARPGGCHAFAETLEEHNRNVRETNPPEC